jgi:hypothetical protein
MANKKSRRTETPRATRVMRVMFVAFSVILILTMILAAFITPR